MARAQSAQEAIPSGTASASPATFGGSRGDSDPAKPSETTRDGQSPASAADQAARLEFQEFLAEFTNARDRPVRTDHTWYLLRERLLRLLASDTGRALVIQHIREADAKFMRRYVDLLVMKCQSQDCSTRVGVSPDSFLPSEVQDAMLASLREGPLDRRLAGLKFFYHYDAYNRLQKDLPLSLQEAARLAVAHPEVTSDQDVFMAISLLGSVDLACDRELADGIVALASNQESPRGLEALSALEHFDPAIVGPVLLQAIKSGSQEARARALHSIGRRYFSTKHESEPFEREFVTAAEACLSEQTRAF